MGKVYQSVRGMMHGTLNRKKSAFTVPLEIPEKTAFDDALEALEQVVTGELARLKESAREDHAAAASKLQTAEQISEDLRTKIAGLEAQLTDAADTLRKKDLAGQKLEESLGAEIGALQVAVKEKEEALQSRDAEIHLLQSETAALSKEIGDLQLALGQTKEAAAGEARRAEQVADDFRAKIAGLETQLKETEESLRITEAAALKMEESLTAEIGALQVALKEKEEALEKREAEINDLESKIRIITKHEADLQLAVGQTKEAAASEAHRAEQLADELRAKIAGLEAQLTEAAETLQRKDAAAQNLEESLGAEIRDLQNAVKRKEEALQSRNAEINDFRSRLEISAKQVSHLEMALHQTEEAASRAARRAEQVIEELRQEVATLHPHARQTEQTVRESSSFVNGDAPKLNGAAAALHVETDHPMNGRKATASLLSKAHALSGFRSDDFQSEAVPAAAEAAREAVSQGAFDRIVAEFSESANVIRSIASLIVRHHVRSLGESMEEFPQTRLAELLESLSREISDDKSKTGFLKRLGKA